jgi:hypothetical protein
MEVEVEVVVIQRSKSRLRIVEVEVRVKVSGEWGASGDERLDNCGEGWRRRKVEDEVEDGVEEMEAK